MVHEEYFFYSYASHMLLAANFSTARPLHVHHKMFFLVTCLHMSRATNFSTPYPVVVHEEVFSLFLGLALSTPCHRYSGVLHRAPRRRCIGLPWRTRPKYL